MRSNTHPDYLVPNRSWIPEKEGDRKQKKRRAPGDLERWPGDATYQHHGKEDQWDDPAGRPKRLRECSNETDQEGSREQTDSN
jgi:hypothetical protein